MQTYSVRSRNGRTVCFPRNQNSQKQRGKWEIYAYWRDDTECKRLTKFPFVCNGCQKTRSCCKHYKYKYIAKDAQENYEIILADARSGVDFDLESKQIFDETIKNGVSNGQSIYHIIQANPDKIRCSVSKTYRLINEQKTLTQRIDLRRSVKLKPRKHYLHKEDNRAIREGRKYVDFLTEYSKTALPVVTEIDTVEGPVDQSECLLTIHITNAHFMIAIILKEHTKECVSQAFANLRRQLGIDLYKKLFNLTLTDRGTEFCDPLAIEIDPDTGEKIANVFFCDSYASYQKGAIEENHTLLRYVISKKACFSGVSQEQIDLVMSHINSYYRKSLDGTPYDMLKALIG